MKNSLVEASINTIDQDNLFSGADSKVFLSFRHNPRLIIYTNDS